MADINTDSTAGGGGGGSSSGANGNGSAGSGDQTALETKNREILAELKKEREARRSLESKVTEIDQQKLQAEGKKDEVISSLQKQINDLRNEHKDKTSKWAYKAVRDRVATKAAEMGAIKTDTVLKVLDLSALQVSVVDDDFNVDDTSLTAQLEGLRKDQPFLFKQAGPQIKDGVPNGKTTMQQTGSKVDFSKMSSKEITDWARKNRDRVKDA